MRVGFGIDQLGVYADPFGPPANASLQNVCYRQLTTDLPRVPQFIPVGECRITRNHSHMKRDRFAVRSSVIPSAIYCWPGSPLRLSKGRTTIDKRGLGCVATPAIAGEADCPSALSRVTGATKQ